MTGDRRRGRAPARVAAGGAHEGTWDVGGGVLDIHQVPGARDQWVLALNGIPQSHVDLADPRTLSFDYIRWAAAVVDAVIDLTAGGRAGAAVDAVHLGAGAGTLPRWVAATRPGSRQLVLDPDERLLAVVREVLGLRAGHGLRIRPEDGRTGLAAVPGASQDVVVRDAFAGMAVPPQLQTVEFVTEVARVLRPSGTYVANLSDRAPFGRLAAEVATATAVLPHVLAVTDPATLRGRRLGNLLLVASRSPLDGVASALTRVLASDPLPARVLDRVGLVSRLPRARPLRDGDDTPEPPEQPSWS